MDRHAMDALVAAMRKRPEWDQFSRMTAMDIHRDGIGRAAADMGQTLVESGAFEKRSDPSDPSPEWMILVCLFDEATLRDIGKKMVFAVIDDMSYRPQEEAA